MVQLSALGFGIGSEHYLVLHVDSPVVHPHKFPAPSLVNIHAAKLFKLNVEQSAATTHALPLYAQSL